MPSSQSSDISTRASYRRLEQLLATLHRFELRHQHLFDLTKIVTSSLVFATLYYTLTGDDNWDLLPPSLIVVAFYFNCLLSVALRLDHYVSLGIHVFTALTPCVAVAAATAAVIAASIATIVSPVWLQCFAHRPVMFTIGIVATMSPTMSPSLHRLAGSLVDRTSHHRQGTDFDMPLMNAGPESWNSSEASGTVMTLSDDENAVAYRPGGIGEADAPLIPWRLSCDLSDIRRGPFQPLH